MPIHSAMIGPSCSKEVAGTRMNRMVFKAAVEGKLDILRRTEHLEDELTPNKNNLLHIHVTGGFPRTDCVLEMLKMCPSLLQKKNSKGETPLHMAAKEGLTEIVKVLVDQVKVQHVADPESGTKLSMKEMVGMINEGGDTALHEAVRNRRLDVVKLLIGEDPEFEYCCNKAGETPLYMAVKRGFRELVGEIITASQSPAHDCPNGTSCSKQVAGTRMNRMVFQAAVEGKLDILRQTKRLEDELTPNKNNLLHIHITGGIPRTDRVLEMLKMCPSLLQKKNSKGETPLHMAAKEGLTEIVKVLVDQVKVQHDADPESGTKLSVKEMVGMINEDGDTALHEAVRYRRLDVVKLLIGEDPESEFEYCCNKAGETLLYMAVKRGFDELVDEILKTCRSPTDFDGPKGLTALHQAVISSNAKGKVGSKILAKMPDLATKTDENGWTPLHYASYLDKVSQAEELLKKDPSAAYMPDKVGKIPLHIAASRNQVQVIEKLISYCPDCSEMVDNNRCNVLHLAVQTRSRKAIELILKNSWGSNLINGKDVNGDTPLHIFASSMFASSLFLVPTLILTHPRVDRMAVNKKGLTAADILSSNSRDPLLKGLVHLVLKINNATPTRPNVTNDVGNDSAAKAKVSEIKKASKIHLIVAALIATVAYAAGFTLPRGYEEDKGSHRGMAVLAKKASFVAFYITDGIAMLLSTVAVVIHFFMTLEEEWEHLYRMFQWASYSTLFSMGAMLAAFAMAACAVLFNFNGAPVIVAALILSFTFFLLYSAYPLLAKWVVRHL